MLSFCQQPAEHEDEEQKSQPHVQSRTLSSLFTLHDHRFIAKYLHECFAHRSMSLETVERCPSTSGLPSPPAIIVTLLTNMSAPKQFD